jgi:hypothetical protein
LLGKFNIWINSECLGDTEQNVVLEVPFDLYKKLLTQNIDRAVTTEFKSLKADIVYEKLKEALWGGDVDGLTEQEILDEHVRYGKYSITQDFSESLEGDIAFLLDYPDEKKQRFIWKLYNANKISEAFFPSKTFENTVGEFVNWFDEKFVQN